MLKNILKNGKKQKENIIRLAKTIRDGHLDARISTNAVGSDTDTANVINSIFV